MKFIKIESTISYLRDMVKRIDFDTKANEIEKKYLTPFCEKD